MRFRIVSSILLSLSFLAAGQSTHTARLPTQVLVRQIDHILIGSNEPAQLFRLFSEKLGLPVAWPFRSYGQFSSGGVSLGNVNIELIGSEHRQSGLTGVALEPTASLSEVISRLDVQGLKHGAPAPFSQKDSSGAERLLWTTVEMTTLPPAGTVFFCKYNFDVDEHRALINREESHAAGPLGIESVMELVIGAKDMAAAQLEWSILLGLVPPSQEALWRIGRGPAIHLVAAQQDHFILLRVKVKSLERARAFLRGQNLLGVDGEHEIAIDPAFIAGADIRLVE